MNKTKPRKFFRAFRRSLENNDAGVSGTRRGDCFLERREFRWASLPRQIALKNLQGFVLC
jgi:hypothetical protein